MFKADDHAASHEHLFLWWSCMSPRDLYFTARVGICVCGGQWITHRFRYNTKASWHGHTLHITGPLWGEPPVSNGFPHKGPVMRRFDASFVVSMKQLQKTFELRVISDDMTLIYRHCYGTANFLQTSRDTQPKIISDSDIMGTYYGVNVLPMVNLR